MAQLIRSAKSGSDWTLNELLAYNITVKARSSASLFGQVPDATLANLDQHFVNTPADGDLFSANISDHALRLLQYLKLASRANAGQASAIDDFAKELLRLLDFEERGLLLRSRHAITLEISGNSTYRAHADVCLVDGRSIILLLLLEDKTVVSARDPEPQLIAGAIATFQYNNRIREQVGLERLDTMNIPCITMIGTRPVFYKVLVTEALSQAVITGQYPTEPTLVDRCVVSPSRRVREGMEAPTYRRVALQHFIAFKELAKSMWQTFLVEG